MRAFAIRHAQRLKFASELGIASETNEDDAPITEEGRSAATKYGAGLKGAIERIFTSPVRRCIETADFLCQGAGLPISSVQVENFLSSTFFGMLGQIDEQAKQDAVRMLLSGQSVAGFKPPREQCAEALLRMAELVKAAPALFVTHDWWMALLLANSTSAFERHGYGIWPDFLESYEIDFRTHSILYRGELYPVSTVKADRASQGGE